MMNHDGWMGGGWGGAMWLWPVLGIAALALIVMLILKVSKR